MKYKTTRNVFLVALLGVGFFGAQVPHANAFSLRNERGPVFTIVENANRGVCLRLAGIETSIAGRLISAQVEYNAQADRRLALLASNSSARGSDIAGLRSSTDKKFEEYVARLKNQAVTDEQKNAVKVFVATIEDATKLRRDAIATATKDFQSGVARVLAGRKEAVASVAKEFDAAMRVAIAEGSSRCKAGDDPRAVRDALKNELANIQKTQYARLSDRSSVDVAIRELSSARKTSIEAANNAFSLQVDEASIKLKSVLQ